MPNLLTISELCEKLKLSEPTIYRMVKKRKIPFTKIGGSLRLDEKQIDRWVMKQKVTEKTY